MLLTLLDFKHPGVEDLILDLKRMGKYTKACRILNKIKDYSHEELHGETGSVSVLLAMLAEYLRGDAQFASVGTKSYLHSFQKQIKAQPLYDLTLFELLLYQEMIDNIEKLSLPISY